MLSSGNYDQAIDNAISNLNTNKGKKSKQEYVYLLDDAEFKGSDYVSVFTKNETNMIIPVRLQNDLLDFCTLGLNDKWTVYLSNKQKGIGYDYGMAIHFR